VSVRLARDVIPQSYLEDERVMSPSSCCTFYSMESGGRELLACTVTMLDGADRNQGLVGL